jgi:hypothetical protein
MSEQFLQVMISSTLEDLRVHRIHARDACWRAGMYPDMEERWAAQPENPIVVSRNRVKEADIYLGIIGNRYGDVKKDQHISVTEMEYLEAEKQRLLHEVYRLADQSSYTLVKTDACNLLARLKRDEGDIEGARMYALEAYHLAWCDGPPYAYHPGLRAAEAHLNALGSQPPIDLKSSALSTLK